MSSILHRSLSYKIIHHVFDSSASMVIVLLAGVGDVTAGFDAVSSEGIVIATVWLANEPVGILVLSCSQETVDAG